MGGELNRRELMQAAARLGVAVPTLAALAGRMVRPQRLAASRRLPDIQFDVADRFAPAQTIEGVIVRFPPVYTSYTTVALTRRPRTADAERLRRALAHVEARFEPSPRGVLALIGYGLPYFARLPRTLVHERVPRLRGKPSRLALEEAVPGPTDPPSVKIERNDLLFVLRSDSPSHLDAALGTLLVPGLMRVTSRRLMFQQPGLPRKMAVAHGLPFAASVHPQSPMWMGFTDQQVDATGPPAIVTFAGNASARHTTAKRGDYFDHASVLHLSHVIEDLVAFYARPFDERVKLMFRANPPPATTETAFVANTFRTPDDARRDVAEQGRIGHLDAIQRASRASDGTPLHIRMDGPGLDKMDMPDGSIQPKLQFAMLVPTADVFARMRRRQASLDLTVDVQQRGIENFTTTTRRQNFLVPPRRHRVFPLLELVKRRG